MASTSSLQSKPTRALQNQALQRHIGGRYLLQLSLVFVAYLVAGKLGQATTNIRSSNLGPVWPAYGVALAAILICGYRAWLAVAAAAFLVAFFSPVSHAGALGQAAATTLAAMAGAFLLYRIANFDRSLCRLSDALSLIVVGGFGSAIVSASLGVFVLYATHVHAYSGLGVEWLIYWLGDATGVLLVTPLALRFSDLSKFSDRHRITELTVLLVFLAVTCFLVFSDLPWMSVKMHVMTFAVLPFIIWAAIRFGLGVTALSIVIVASIATVETALGSGPFASNTTVINAVLLDVFFAVLSVTGLSLAAVIGEREHMEREREEVVSRQAAMEERLRAADMMRESEEKLREYEKAVEGAEDMIGVIDREYRYLVANRRYLKMRNLAREQVVGRLVPEVLGKDVFETVIKPKLDECFAGKVVRYERRFSYPAVGERDLLLSYFPIEGPNGIDRAACILHDITDRKRAEEALAEMNRTLEAQGSLLRSRQELLRVFVKNVPAAVAMFDREMRYLEVSDRWCTTYPADGSQILGRSHYDVFPDLPDRYKEIHRRGLAGETIRADEDRWNRKVGTTWSRWEVRPWKTPDGAVGGILIFAEDITHRKQMEEALSDMSRKLIESQEQERARIARELHDDINQRLALLAIEIAQLRENPSEVENRGKELQDRIGDISHDVEGLAHDLHSSKLKYLGVVAGIKGWCREFAERQKMEIDFKSDVISVLPQEVGLSLLRVLQEALHNAIKYSGVRSIYVELWEHSGEVHLIVSDLGRGFDLETALQGKGLGLTSMRERVRLVNGTISIESKPMGGTTIRVCVPLGSEHGSERAAG